MILVLLRLLLAAGVALGTAVSTYPALGWQRRWRLPAIVGVGSLILLSPLIVPADAPFPRFLASVVAVALIAKLTDLHRHVENRPRPDFATFLAFLPNIQSVVLRKLADEPQSSLRRDLTRLTLAGLAFAVGVVCLWRAFQVGWQSIPFAVEHTVKVTILFLTLAVPASVASAAMWRLLGGRAREFMDHPYFARTPADFWRRYNRPAQQFFQEDVFKPVGGLRAPLRSVLTTFALSAVFHEYLFVMAAGRVQGYQTAFFMLHGVAVAATLRVKPHGWMTVPCVAATLVFNLASSVLFFASLNELMPFYANPPDWMVRPQQSLGS